MRLSYGLFGLSALALGCALTLAQAQTAPQTNSSGALPGNAIGTRSSLPLSPYASNMTPNDTKSTIAPTSPAPNVGPDADVRDFLVASRQALSVGQTGTAQEALERAETEILSRSVLQSQADETSQNPTVLAITQARMTLGSGNVSGAMRQIDDILASGAPELEE
jgi:hypothetical protein